MRTLTRIASVGLGAATCVLLLEGLLRVLPVMEGINAADHRPQWPIRTLVPGSSYTHSMGWNFMNVQRGVTNNYGYASPVNYTPGAGGVAVVGDSFIENLMNPYDEGLSGALQKRLGREHPVMGFGMSGAAMAHYLGSAPLIAAEFEPEWVVIVLGLNDFTSSFSVGPGRYRWAPDRMLPVELVPERRPSELDKLLRSMGLVRYVRGNLRMTLNTLFKNSHPARPTEQTCVADALSKEDERLLDAYIELLPSQWRVPRQRIVLVFDSPRKLIYQPELARWTCPTRNSLANQRLQRRALAAGLQVVDTLPIFEQHYRTTGRPVDFLPVDGHWNGLGHGLVADVVAQIISSADLQFAQAQEM
jgi:hypothetical protein